MRSAQSYTIQRPESGSILMNKLVPLVAVVLLLGLAMFVLLSIKYKVHYLRRDISEIERQLMSEKQSLHVLQAEWSYLTNPSRIEKLAAEHLHLGQVTVAQFQPEIPSPVPAPEPELVAQENTPLVLAANTSKPLPKAANDVFAEYEAMQEAAATKDQSKTKPSTPAPVELIMHTQIKF